MKIQQNKFVVISILLLVGCTDYGFSRKANAPGGDTPAIEVDPTLLDFWSVRSGEEQVLSFAIRSVGDGTLAVDDLIPSGSASFTLLDGDPPFNLAPGESAELHVAFTPLDPGTQTGLITVTSNDPDRPSVDVDLTGSGLLPWLEITPDSHDFGDFVIPCADAVQLTLQNTGDDTLDVSAVDYLGDGQLHLREDMEVPFSLSPGSYTTAWVELDPAYEGEITGTLSVTSNDPRGVVEATQRAAATWAGDGRDTFTVDTDPPVDLLFAVDQSSSMNDDAVRLADNFSVFIDTLQTVTSGWHLGVVTYDHGCFNDGVLDASTSDLESVFAAAVSAGDDDIANTEALFRLVDRALQQTDSKSCNEDFLREGAPLHVIVVSDEPERSTETASAWTWDYWLARYYGYVDGESLLKVSGVIDVDGCNEGADGYAQAVAATGGLQLSICSGDWSDYALQLAEASTEFAWVYAPSQEAVPTSVAVFVDGVELSAGWSWDDSLAAVVFDARPEGSTVELTYKLVSECE